MEQMLYIQNEISQRLHLGKTTRRTSCSANYIPYSSEHEDLLKNEQGCRLKTVEKHELLVCDDYIHEDVSPGFRYRVKENGSNKLLFGGQAKYLEQVGQGYGKRLTFETEDILENDNFFWTDSNHGGYTFTIEAVSVGDKFLAKIGKSEIGFATATCVGANQEIIDSVIHQDEVRKRVKVEFDCKMSRDNSHEGQISLNLQGIVTLVKRKNDAKCQLTDIKILSRSGCKVVLLPAATR